MNQHALGIDRRELVKRGALGAAFVASGSVLTGCGGAKETARTGRLPDGKGRPVRGGELRFASISGGSAETLSVASASFLPDLIRVYQLYDPLCKPDSAGKIVPWLAESFEPNRDATKWTFRLREDVVWHDGKPLTADDLEFTVRSWADRGHNLSTIAKPLVEFGLIRKRDNRTVEVSLRQPLAQLPSLLSNWNACVIQDGFTNFSRPVGTGPFKFESFSPGSQSVFVANRDYWRKGEPYFDRVIIDSSATDESARFDLLRAGDVDAMTEVPFSIARVNQDNPRIRLERSTGPGGQAIGCRVDKAPFNDPRVMEALKLLMDRHKMVQVAYAGFAGETNDCPGRGLQYWAEDLKRERDVEKARSLLKSAGREGLALECITTSGSPGFAEAATIFQENARDGGVKIKVKKIDGPSYFSDASGYLTRPMSVSTWINIDSLTAFYLQWMTPDAVYNDTHWHDQKSQKLLREALAETDTASAAEKWGSVQDDVYHRGGYLVTGNLDRVDAYATNVAGLNPSVAGGANRYYFAGAWKAS